jgi:uncharacterized protein YbjT (DUF2867 family)
MVAMTDHAHTDSTILVLGGTGKTGRRIVERLAARGVPTRVGSRSGEPPFDWEDRTTWEAALHGVGAVYISYFPDLALPGAADTVGAFADLAVALGVRRHVLLSGRGEDEAERAERRVQAAGGDCTIVRATWFSQNFSESFMLDGVLAGEIALPVTDVREPFVDVEDIADIAVAALTEEGHAGRLYELTGPRLLTFADAVGEIAGATGRDVRFVPIAMDDFTSSLTEQQVPPDFVALLRYLFGEVMDGRNEKLTDGVRQALGREPRDFRDYARDTAATGVWAAELSASAARRE